MQRRPVLQLLDLATISETMLNALVALGVASARSTRYNVLDYGAKGDGVSDDTSAFEKAIAAAATNLHSRSSVIIPSGLACVIRPINLTSSMELYISANASLKGMANTSSWPIIAPLPSYGQGRDFNPHGARYSSLLRGINLTNVTIRGEGPTSVIDGQGEYWWNRSRPFLYSTCRQCPDTKTCCLNNTRGHLIEFMHSRNVNIFNLAMRDSPFWNNHFFDCDDVHVNGVQITAG
jgi:polygalacturonase